MKKLYIILNLLLLIASGVAAQSYKIAYNVAQDDADSDYDIFVMNPDGTGKTNITNNPDVAWTYHADRDRIFFITDRNACKRCFYLYSMDTNGRNIRKLSDLRLEDSWMSSRNQGKEMVVSGRIGDDVRYQLFIIDLENGKYRRLTSESAALHRDPVFSPDGSQVVFAYKKDRIDREEHEELYIMNADGSNRRRLTNYPQDDKKAKWHEYRAGPPHWNRKENFITYQSVQNGKSSLFAVTPDGKKNWKLTDHKLNEGYHSWSPDGRWLAIEMFDDKQTEFGIYLMDYQSKETRKLTTPEEFKFQQGPVFVENRIPSPAEVVRRFTEAYNLHDVEGMMSLVSEDIKWFSIDGATLSTETANAGELRGFLTDYFKKCADCRSTISDFRLTGNTVSFTETTARGQSSLAVYDVVEGKIVRAYYFPADRSATVKFDGDLAKRLGADKYGMKTYVFAILKTGPKKVSVAENQTIMNGHLRNIQRLADEGKLILAGPFLENDSSRGIFVFDVRTKEEARELIRTDPGIVAGVFDFELRLWYGSAGLIELKKIHEMISETSIVD